VVKYGSNTGLRAGVAIGAVVIIVAAIVISKRRAHGMGDEAPASAEISGATSPAASVGSPDETVAEVTAADATVSAVPSLSAGEASHRNGNGNGHVATGSASSADSPPAE
jgi:K(+)-stimulated pyrophosphate-energized sodium pump